MWITERLLKNYYPLLLTLIVLLAVIVRVYDLNKLPAILNRDEAALAYNAYLLDQTSKDEWGRTRPLFLESFGDYKLPGYPLFIELFFKFLPANDLTVRLPSALAGSLLVILIALLAQRFSLRRATQLTIAFFAALMPFAVFYSRMAFEANLALSLMVLVMLGCFRQFKRYRFKDFLLDFTTILLALLMLFTYNTPLILLPFIIICTAIYRGIFNWKNWFFLAIGLIGVLIFASVNLLPLSAQKSGITIFSDETVWMNWIQYRENFDGIWQRILGHKYFYFAQIIVQNFIKSLLPSFLLIRGGNHPWHNLPGFGHLFWTQYLLFCTGIVITIWEFWLERRRPAKIKKQAILLSLLLASLLPSVVTVDSPHATRSLLFFVLTIIFSGFAIEKIMSHSFSKYWLALILILFSFESANYLRHYFIDYRQNQNVFQPGFNSVIQKATQENRDLPIAVIDSAGFHYIIAAWYLKTPPEKYFSTIVMQQPDSIGFRYGQQLQNLHFIAQPQDRSAQEKVEIIWQNNQWEINHY
ncbi:MAG: ArnT family glycosyltransferase [Patescibacteria group bacterium]